PGVAGGVVGGVAFQGGLGAEFVDELVDACLEVLGRFCGEYVGLGIAAMNKCIHACTLLPIVAAGSRTLPGVLASGLDARGGYLAAALALRLRLRGLVGGGGGLGCCHGKRSWNLYWLI